VRCHAKRVVEAGSSGKVSRRPINAHTRLDGVGRPFERLLPRPHFDAGASRNHVALIVLRVQSRRRPYMSKLVAGRQTDRSIRTDVDRSRWVTHHQRCASRLLVQPLEPAVAQRRATEAPCPPCGLMVASHR
jgi:hypothetical protein